MQIANDIMKIVEKKEEDEANFNRCINTLTCPKCGENLEKTLCHTYFIDWKYTCKCGFEHKKLEKLKL